MYCSGYYPIDTAMMPPGTYDDDMDGHLPAILVPSNLEKISTIEGRFVLLNSSGKPRVQDQDEF